MRELATLQRKRYPETDAARRLEKALRGKGGALTRADASALTGLSSDEAEGALKSLLGNYRSHLAVTEEGELIYRFDRAMERRDAVPLGERARALGHALWKGFTVFFKIWIAVTLVAYVAAFVAMLIALVFARSSSDRDDRRRGDDGFGFPWILWWMMPDWAPYEVRQRQLARRRKPDKRFYQQVFDFVFGPKRARPDELGAERELVAFLRARDGRITATDLVSLTGWSYARAEEEATRLLVDYDGEPEVSESGAIIYVFPSLRRTAGDDVDAEWRYTWQETRQLAPLTGNSQGANTLIGALNGFNLVGGFAIGPAFLARFGLATPALEALVMYFPLAFSSVFYAVPAARWARHKRGQRRMARAALRAELVREIIARRGAASSPEELARIAEERAGRHFALAAGEGKRALERLLAELDGDVAPSESGAGDVRYQFPRVAEELEAVEAARKLAPVAERSPGEVVFSSQDEPAALPEPTKH